MVKVYRLGEVASGHCLDDPCFGFRRSGICVVCEFVQVGFDTNAERAVIGKKEWEPVSESAQH